MHAGKVGPDAYNYRAVSEPQYTAIGMQAKIYSVHRALRALTAILS